MMNGQNDLGHPEDDWAEEPRTYPITRVSRGFTAGVPSADVGLSGVVLVHMEEDSFARETALLVGARVEGAVRRAIRKAIVTGAFDGVDVRALTSSIVRRLTSRLLRAVRTANLAGIVRGLAELAAPDDFGGVAVAGAVTSGTLAATFAGSPPTSAADFVAGVTLGPMGCGRVALRYPVGDLSSLPWIARFAGDHVYNASLCTSRFDGLI